MFGPLTLAVSVSVLAGPLASNPSTPAAAGAGAFRVARPASAGELMKAPAMAVPVNDGLWYVQVPRANAAVVLRARALETPAEAVAVLVQGIPASLREDGTFHVPDKVRLRPAGDADRIYVQVIDEQGQVSDARIEVRLTDTAPGEALPEPSVSVRW